MKVYQKDLIILKNNMEDNIYFNPGQIVQLKQDIPNKPTMIVIKKEVSLFKHDSKRLNDKKPILIGIKCRWFTTTGELQEAIFNTKDLQLVK